MGIYNDAGFIVAPNQNNNTMNLYNTFKKEIGDFDNLRYDAEKRLQLTIINPKFVKASNEAKQIISTIQSIFNIAIGTPTDKEGLIDLFEKHYKISTELDALEQLYNTITSYNEQSESLFFTQKINAFMGKFINEIKLLLKALVDMMDSEEWNTYITNSLISYFPVRTGESIDIVAQSVNIKNESNDTTFRSIITYQTKRSLFNGKVAHTGNKGYGKLYTPITSIAQQKQKILRYTEKGAYYILNDPSAVNDPLSLSINEITQRITYLYQKILSGYILKFEGYAVILTSKFKERNSTFKSILKEVEVIKSEYDFK